MRCFTLAKDGARCHASKHASPRYSPPPGQVTLHCPLRCVHLQAPSKLIASLAYSPGAQTRTRPKREYGHQILNGPVERMRRASRGSISALLEASYVARQTRGPAIAVGLI